jgi:aspartyl-tRNA(Asn)/glutamyl-tRNA(Gln) amidotransferase subunit A
MIAADPSSLSIASARRLLRSGQLSCEELVAACFKRIREVDDSILAWARLRIDGALDDARAIDARRDDQTGRLPLAGIPVGLKDIFCTAGFETSAGSRVLSGWVPDADAFAVRMIKQAGAVVLGKTATTEFASADPAPTRNPVDLAHTPGGSSAGSAAAVAAHMCLGALGTQTAGSILRPAAYCGVVGFKPTYGAVSREGVIPLGWSMDHVGPIAKTVEDAALLYAALRGDQRPSAERGTDRSYIVGVADRFFDASDTHVAAAFESALDALRELGWKLQPVRLPDCFEAAAHAAMVVLAVEIASVHEDWFDTQPEVYGPRLRGLIESGRRILAPSYLRAQRLRRRAAYETKTLFDGVDFLVTPTTPAPAPLGFETTGDASYNMPFSSFGLPALSVPVPARTTHLPIGIQLIADHCRDETLLEAGRVFEQHLSNRAQLAGHRA